MASMLIDFFSSVVIRSLVGVLYLLPEAFAFQAARLIVRIIRWTVVRLDKVSLRNLELTFPEKPAKEREQIMCSAYDVLARNICEFARIPCSNKQRMEVVCETADAKAEIDRVRAQAGKVGILFGAPHFGAFELFLQVKALADRPTAALTRELGLRRLDLWCDKRRESWGNEVFRRKGGFPEVIRRLNLGQDVIVMFDQNVKKNHATFVEFFGIPVAATKAMGLAAVRTGAPVVFISGYEYQPGRHRFVARQVIPNEDPALSLEEKVDDITQKLHRCLEEMIREHPDHWFWVHRRFKTRPPGEPENIYLDEAG